MAENKSQILRFAPDDNCLKTNDSCYWAGTDNSRFFASLRMTIRVKAVRPERDALEIWFPRVLGYRFVLPSQEQGAAFTPDAVLELTPELVGPSETRSEGIERAYKRAFAMLQRRISLMLSLPLASLDSMSLQRELDSIGRQ